MLKYCRTVLIALALVGCAANLTRSETLTQALNSAVIVATSADRIAVSLGETLSVEQEKDVRDSARVVFATVKVARASLEVGDAAGAEAQIAAIAAELVLLNNLIATHKGAP